jgi:hypothetical protein
MEPGRLAPHRKLVAAPRTMPSAKLSAHTPVR